MKVSNRSGPKRQVLIITQVLTLCVWPIYHMEVLTENSPLGCILLLILHIPPSIALGYLLHFFFDDILAVQEWMTEFLNIILAFPWMITTFAVTDATLAVHTAMGIIPSYLISGALCVPKIGSQSVTKGPTGSVFRLSQPFFRGDS